MRKPTLSTSLGTWLRRGGGVKVAPVVLALGAALLLLRSAPRAGKSDDIPGYLAYMVEVGKTVSFAIEPGDDDLALTLHLAVPDLWPDSQNLRFPVSVRFVDEAGNELWTGRAMLDATPNGAIADGSRSLTSPRVMRLELPPRERGAKLFVTVEKDGDAEVARAAAVRLSRRAPRQALWHLDPPRADEHTKKIAERANTFGWAYVPDETLAELYARPISRRAADEGESDLVHVRTIAKPAPALPAPSVPGVLVNSARGAAYTVRGPGKVRLTLAPEQGDALPVTLRTVDNMGMVSEQQVTVSAPGFEQTFDAPKDGAITVSALCDDAIGVRARAFVQDGAAPLGDAVVADAAGEIRPDERRLPLWRLTTGGEPLVATLVGDGLARVSARAVAPAEGAEPPLLSFRLVSPDGKVLSESTGHVFHAPSRLDLIDAGTEVVPAPEAVTFLASAPIGARLEVRALQGTADVTIEAADEPAAVLPAPAYQVELESARLRFAPYLRRRWVAFRPDNHAKLTPSALVAQVRLEPVGTSPGGGPHVAVEPYAPRTRQLLAERMDERPDDWAIFHRTGWTIGKKASVKIASTGDMAGRLALDYHVGPEALGGMLRVSVDGALRHERKLSMTRGRVRLDGLTPGAREVVIEGAPGSVFTAAPLAGGDAHVWAERAVWRIHEGGALTVPVSLGERQGKTLHVVLYADEHPTEVGPLSATVTIDEGARGAHVQATTGRTRMTRKVQLVPVPTTSRWLDRRDGARARAHFAVRLGADLGPGTHRVKVTLDEGPSRMHARFYVTGTPRTPTVQKLGAEWDED